MDNNGIYNGDNQGAGGVFTGQVQNQEPEQNESQGQVQNQEPGQNMNHGQGNNDGPYYGYGNTGGQNGYYQRGGYGTQNQGQEGPCYGYGGPNPSPNCSGPNPDYGGQGPVYTDYSNGQGYPCMPQGGYENEMEEPVSVGEWIVSLLLVMFVPCVNIVLMFVWAFSKKEKKSKSNFFKAQLIITGIMLGLYIIILLIFGTAILASLSA